MKVYTVSPCGRLKDDVTALIAGKAVRPSTRTKTRIAHKIRLGDEVYYHSNHLYVGRVVAVYKKAMHVRWMNGHTTSTSVSNLASVEGDKFCYDIERFIRGHREIIAKDRKSQYQSWKIPKKSGGFRQIDAPKEELSSALYDLKKLIESYGPLYHTGAFAYMKGREPLQAVRYHKESEWFLKLDLHDFFGQTTVDTLKTFLPKIRPFCFLNSEAIESVVDLCQLNGRLPQGTCVSPLLTNIVMIPFDYTITRELKREGIRYTRYADDLLFSAPKWFPPKTVIEKIESTMKDLGYPYAINADKTRFGSVSGRNFNLGLMLNGNHNITTGWERKKHLKSEIHNFFRDEHEKSAEENRMAAYHILGIIGYLTHIEPEYTNMLMKYLSKTYQMNVIGHLKQVIAGESV